MVLDAPNENDITTKTKGFNFVIDKDLARQYQQFSIVYQNGIISKGLRIYAGGASHC